MNYQIITDEKALKDFIDWLPELKENEKYYLCLFARNKYCRELTHIKSDKAQLKRFVSDKARMFDKIKQLEVELGAYKQKETPVPQEALALYITTNPRDMYKASINTMVKFATSIRDQNVLMNPHQEALSEIQKAKSRTVWVDFDIDEKKASIIKEVKEYLNGTATYKIVETRGGYHLLVKPDTVHRSAKKDWYTFLSKIEGVDQAGDLMMPVPGTYQGGFTPKFV